MYYFHLNECGKLTRDDEGIDLKGIDEVRTEACRAAREVMCAELANGKLCLACNVEVHDADGKTVFFLPFNDAVTITGLRGS